MTPPTSTVRGIVALISARIKAERVTPRQPDFKIRLWIDPRRRREIAQGVPAAAVRAGVGRGAVDDARVVVEAFLNRLSLLLEIGLGLL